jgi:hypothetical protein
MDKVLHPTPDQPNPEDHQHDRHNDDHRHGRDHSDDKHRDYDRDDYYDDDHHHHAVFLIRF